MNKIKITIDLPSVDQISAMESIDLMRIDMVRQMQLRVTKEYLEDSYLKCIVEVISSGDTYSSPTKLIATPRANLNFDEASRVCATFGVNFEIIDTNNNDALFMNLLNDYHAEK